MTWTLTISRDGETVAELVPGDDWDIAGLLAPGFVAMGDLTGAGGKVSVAKAVLDQRVAERPVLETPGLFDTGAAA